MQAKYDAAGERLDYRAGTARSTNNRTINTRICHVVAMFQIFQRYGRGDAQLKIRHIVKQKETEPIRRVFPTREQIEQVLDIASRFSGCS